MSDALETQGFMFEIGDGASPLDYTEVKEVVSFNGFDGQAAEIDVTHLQSVAKEFIMGLQDFGTFSMDVNFLPSDPGQLIMRAAKADRSIQDLKLTFSDGTIAIFQGYILSSPVSGGVDAKVNSSFAVRITGDVVITPA
jgi:hypothetical protein